MIIDCHGHYTTAPDELGAYREQQKIELEQDPLTQHARGTITISDDQIRESLEGAQLKLQNDRGTDLTLFSPRASWMGHHIGNQHTSSYWTEHCNDLIHRITELYPNNFIGVAQLPQSPGADLKASAIELDLVGAVRGIDPETGHYFDDTKGYIDTASITDSDRQKIFEGNTRKVFPRLNHL